MAVGVWLGLSDTLGALVGCEEGLAERVDVGDNDGVRDGIMVGRVLGRFDELGASDGRKDGEGDGIWVGSPLGLLDILGWWDG
mmetsp:Transcript_2256/g.2611  ORF Transcript_2256/g.2611 Transcript_2256/m.2611 type:complete len:83 (-) Transcript_2256:103-351(-)